MVDIRKRRDGRLVGYNQTTTDGPKAHLIISESETKTITVDWSEYFTRTTETVTVDLSSYSATATKSDLTDSAAVTVSGIKGYGRVTLKVSIDGGETFEIPLIFNSYSINESRDYAS